MRKIILIYTFAVLSIAGEIKISKTSDLENDLTVAAKFAQEKAEKLKALKKENPEEYAKVQELKDKLITEWKKQATSKEIEAYEKAKKIRKIYDSLPPALQTFVQKIVIKYVASKKGKEYEKVKAKLVDKSDKFKAGFQDLMDADTTKYMEEQLLDLGSVIEDKSPENLNEIKTIVEDFGEERKGEYEAKYSEKLGTLLTPGDQKKIKDELAKINEKYKNSPVRKAIEEGRIRYKLAKLAEASE